MTQMIHTICSNCILVGFIRCCPRQHHWNKSLS